MKTLPALLLVASYQLTPLIHCASSAQLTRGMKEIQETEAAATPSFQSSYAESKSVTPLKSERLDKKNFQLTTEGWSNLPSQEPGSLHHRMISTAVNPKPNPVTAKPFPGSSYLGLRNGFTKIVDSSTQIINKFLLTLQLRRATFSERFANNKVRYTEVRLEEPSRGPVAYKKCSMADLAAAQKEFPRLGKFCKRIVEQTDALQKAEILENSMDKLRKMPAQKITPSEFEGWLQAFAVIMGVGNPQFAPDVRMETITQFGLLDLMTKFDNGDQTSTEKYYQSTESLQQFLKSRFLLIKDSPRLKEKANEIHWASEVLYYDRRVDLNSDLARYETWLKADETLQITIPKLNRARAQARQYTLIEELKARAAMSNKETTSQDKSAAIILLCILGCTTPKTGHLFEEAQASTKQMALNAIKEFLPSEGGTSSSHRTEVSIFPHNAQRVVQFHQSYLFPNELMHHKNFKEIIVAGETSGPIFKIMKYNVLTRAIEQEPELTKAFQSSTKSILERQEILKDFMNMLTGSYTNQMPAAKFEICIQTIAVLMKVADAKPCAVEFENEVDSGLLKLMDKFRGKEDPESIKFYESARNLQFFLKSRRERYQTKNNEVILTDKGKSVA